jgi:PiT family inorganic phosphate transporter
MLLPVFSILAPGGLAWANGANDNFKGVATLYGSGTTSFREALAWATLTTAVGGAMAFFFGQSLLKVFTGSGLVTHVEPGMLAAAGAAAAGTILLATWLGMPTSTTHALTGGLLGSAWFVAGSDLNLGSLLNGFLLPLLLSPIVAVLGAMVLYALLHAARVRMGITHDSCLCVVRQPAYAVAGTGSRSCDSSSLSIESGKVFTCYHGRLAGLNVQSGVNGVHFLSAGAVCFSRALNDTPKIVALFLAGSAFTPAVGWFVAIVAMCAGGWLNARKVAETMSLRITDLNSGQGLTANLVTSALVFSASLFALPVSTTHVSCGALFGIGQVTGKRRWKTIGSIAGAWALTLPLAAALGAAFMPLLKGF